MKSCCLVHNRSPYLVATACLACLQVATAAAAARKLALRRVWAAWQAHLHSQRRKHRQWCSALLFAGRQQAQRVLSTWRIAARAEAVLRKQQHGTTPPLDVPGAGAAGLAASSMGDDRALVPGTTALLLARLRRLRSEAEAASSSCAAASAAAHSAAGAAGAGSLPAERMGTLAAAAAAAAPAPAASPRTSARQAVPEWRASSIANLVTAAGLRLANQFPCDSSDSPSSGPVTVGSSTAGWLDRGSIPRPAPRRPHW